MYLYFFLLIFLFSMMNFLFFLYFIFKDLIYFFEFELMIYNSCKIILNFMFDWMSFLFMSFVLFISSIVIFYSWEYMIEDKNKIRFIYLVFLFILSMMFLIVSPNLIFILLGWDGLGLVSYCLVIYFQNSKSYNAGMLTALCNRVGDVALLISISLMLSLGSWSFYFYLNFMNLNKFYMFMLMMAAMTKSAQIPFSSWLPAAMAAPTPVSALVHSSTLVTAGVYLLIRFYNYLMLNFELLIILLILSSLTMFMSGLGANYEMDFKKIIALSTLSQLGLMMSSLCMGMMKLAFFHLLMHALFKALLFLCAGMFIHGMMNFQDVRVYGGVYNQMYISLIFFNISNLTLCGMPFLSGFYSKDMILEFIFMSNLNLIIFFFFFSTGLTVIYSFRLMNFCLNNYSGFMILCMSESNFMLYLMNFLLLISIIGGSLFLWLIFPFFNLVMLSFFFKIFIFMICFLGMLFGMIFFNMINFKFLKLNFIVSYFFSLMWFMPILFSNFFNFKFLKFFNIYKFYLDLGWMEYFGGGMIMKFNQFLKFFINYNLKMYFFFMFVLLILFLFL